MKAVRLGAVLAITLATFGLLVRAWITTTRADVPYHVLTISEHMEQVGVVLSQAPGPEQFPINAADAIERARKGTAVGFKIANGSAYRVLYREPGGNSDKRPARPAWAIVFSDANFQVPTSKPGSNEATVANLTYAVVLLESDGVFIGTIGVPDAAWEGADPEAPFGIPKAH